MANGVSTNYMLALCKTVYEDGVANDKYQASQFLSDMVKEGAEFGKEIKYAAQYGDGGNYGVEYDLISNNPTTGVQNLEWTMTPGRLTGMFFINQPDLLMTDTDKKAYMDALANNMSGCYSGLSRTLATFLYGGKAGVIDKIKTQFTISTLTNQYIPLTSAGALKLDVGSRIVFATAGADNTAIPTSPLAASGAYATVKKWDDSGVYVDFEAGFSGVTIYVGDYIELYTARRGNNFNGIEGLPDIIPSIGDRDANDTNWTTYIAQDFRGVDRSQAVSKLAGQFVKADSTATTPNSDALVKLLKQVKRAGRRSEDIRIVINDESFENMLAELKGNMWQSVNADKGGKVAATAGLNNIGVAFEESFTNKLYTDAYCTEGLAYAYDKEDFRFRDVGHVASKVLDPVSNGAEGVYDIEGVGKQGFGDTLQSGVNYQKLFEVVPNGKDGSGNLWEISAKIYGNFQSKYTARNGVAVLTA